MLNNILWTTKILHIIQYSNVNHINVQYTTKKKRQSIHMYTSRSIILWSFLSHNLVHFLKKKWNELRQKCFKIAKWPNTCFPFLVRHKIFFFKYIFIILITNKKLGTNFVYKNCLTLPPSRKKRRIILFFK